MHITKDEITALDQAIDFIHSNADGADDVKEFEMLANNLRYIFDKARKERHKTLVRQALKKLNKK